MYDFHNAARDNTYNSENDFSAEFTWTAWLRDDDLTDWVWNRERAYIAICRHRGGDVRGNYGPVSLHRVDGCIADSGFLDWVLGWSVSRLEGFNGIELDEIDDIRAQSIVDAAQEDERLTEQCSIGYASLPASMLYDECKTDDCYWFGGAAILKTTDGDWLVARPYHYQSEVITPENGSGWLCDAQIDTDDFIEQTIGPDILPMFPESRKLDAWIESLEWDHDEAVGKLCRADSLILDCGSNY